MSRLPGSILSLVPGAPAITLRIHPEPIKVAYQHVVQLVPRLYETYPTVRYFVHLGVHDEITRYRLERLARKGPYSKLDVDGGYFPQKDGDGGKVWKKAPSQVESTVDIDSIVGKLAAEG